MKAFSITWDKSDHPTAVLNCRENQKWGSTYHSISPWTLLILGSLESPNILRDFGLGWPSPKPPHRTLHSRYLLVLVYRVYSHTHTHTHDSTNTNTTQNPVTAN